MRDEKLTEAVRIIGGNAAVAKIFGISREAVGQWERCPAERVQAVAAATGNRITPEQLRPDIFTPSAPSPGQPEASVATETKAPAADLNVLAKYLADNKISLQEFADQIAKPVALVIGYCDGTGQPDIDTVQRIFEITGGLVRAEDFFIDPVSGATPGTRRTAAMGEASAGPDQKAPGS